MRPPSKFPSLKLGTEVREWALQLQQQDEDAEQDSPIKYEPIQLTQIEEDEYRLSHQIHEQIVSQYDFRYAEEASNNNSYAAARDIVMAPAAAVPPAQEAPPQSPPPVAGSSKVAANGSLKNGEESRGMQKFELLTNEGSYEPPSCVRKPRSFFTPFKTALLHLPSMRDLTRIMIEEEAEEEERAEREDREERERKQAEKEGNKVTSNGVDEDKHKDKDKDKDKKEDKKGSKDFKPRRNPSGHNIPMVKIREHNTVREGGPMLLSELRNLYPLGVPVERRNCIVVYNLPPNYPYHDEFSAFGDVIGIDFVDNNGVRREDCVYFWYKNHLQAEYAAKTMHNMEVQLPGPSSSKPVTQKIGCWRLFDYDEDKGTEKKQGEKHHDEDGASF